MASLRWPASSMPPTRRWPCCCVRAIGHPITLMTTSRCSSSPWPSCPSSRWALTPTAASPCWRGADAAGAQSRLRRGPGRAGHRVLHRFRDAKGRPPGHFGPSALGVERSHHLRLRDPRRGRGGRADQPRPVPLARRAPGPSSDEKSPTTAPSSTSLTRWLAPPGLHHQLDRHRHHLSRSPPPRPCPHRGPHPLRQRHRAAQPALRGLRQQRLLGRVDLRGPGPLRLHPRPGLDGDLAGAEPKRLRYALLHTAGRLTTTSRGRRCGSRANGLGDRIGRCLCQTPIIATDHLRRGVAHQGHPAPHHRSRTALNRSNPPLLTPTTGRGAPPAGLSTPTHRLTAANRP